MKKFPINITSRLQDWLFPPVFSLSALIQTQQVTKGSYFVHHPSFFCFYMLCDESSIFMSNLNCSMRLYCKINMLPRHMLRYVEVINFAFHPELSPKTAKYKNLH